MQKTRRYEIEGLIIDIPIHYDQQSQMYIEDYPDFIENPIWTEKGNRVLFSGTDACESANKGALDCGSCKYFMRAGEHTWFGICKNEEKKSFNGGNL